MKEVFEPTAIASKIVLGLVCVQLNSCAPASSSAQEPASESVSVGGKLSICADCPIFVRVPQTDRELRDIKFVAQHPITWTNYLASVREGACALPVRANRLVEDGFPKQDILRDFGIDWPISILNTSEIQCYSDWLQHKTDLIVAVPTEQEWNWFAAGDLAGYNFPWGDQAQDPPAAVPGVEIYSQDEFTGLANGTANLFIPGVRVGLFAPNSWGLFEIIGNQFELTSTVFTGEEWLRLNPGARYGEDFIRNDVVIIKGGSRYSASWKDGINGPPRTARLFDGTFSTFVSVRLVLIGEALDE